MFDDQKPRNRLLEAQNRHRRPIIDPQKPKIDLQRAKISSQWPKIESRRPKMDPHHRGQNWLPELQKRIPDTQNWLPDAKINSQCLKSTPICSKLIPRHPKSRHRAKINKKTLDNPPQQCWKFRIYHRTCIFMIFPTNSHPHESWTSQISRIDPNQFYPSKERFFRTLSEGSHWFECSLLP